MGTLMVERLALELPQKSATEARISPRRMVVLGSDDYVKSPVLLKDVC